MKVFVVRLLEQAAVTFVLGFGAVYLAGDAPLTMSALGGALAAGLRAVYGLLVKEVGTDSASPSVK